MENILKRINEIAVNEEITLTALETKIQASKGVLSRAYKNNTDIQAKWLTKIVENYPQYDPLWLLTGKGDMKSDPSILKLEPTIDYNSKNRRTKDRVLQSQEIPIYDLEASAGFQSVISGNNKGVQIIDYIRIPGLPKCDGALRAKGDSMYPLVKSGDFVAFKGQSIENAFYGEMYVIALTLDDWEDMITIKFLQQSDKIDHVRLVSQNQHHPPKDVHKKYISAIALVRASIRLH